MHSKQFAAILGCALFAVSPSVAADLAADLAVAPAPILEPIAVFTWTGPYLGANAGYGFGTGDGRPRQQSISFPTNTNLPSGGFTNTNPLLNGIGTPINVFTLPTTLTLGGTAKAHDGFIGGGQIGYNQQITPGSGVVFGVEADAQYVDFGSVARATAVTVPVSPALIGQPLFNPPASVDRQGEPGIPGDFDAGLRSVTFLRAHQSKGSVQWFGTVRGRLGYAFDRVLVYGTGGLAYGAGDRRDAGGTAIGDRVRTGWVAGGGIEYALPTDSWLNVLRSSAVTVKIESLYVSLDQGSERGTGAVLYARDQNGYVYYAPAASVAAGAGRNRQDDFVIARAGLNYKF